MSPYYKLTIVAILVLSLAACNLLSASKPTAAPTPTLALPDPTAAIDALPSPAASPTPAAAIGGAAPVNTAVVTATIRPTSTSPPTETGGMPLALMAADSAPPAFREHFFMARPFSRDYTSSAARNYAYGSTDEGQYRPHHAIDIMNPRGTPVRAVAAGTVVFAGDDRAQVFGPHADFYGNLVIIEHAFRVGEDRKVYSLYGHLSETSVSAGQEVALYDTVGLVGATGIAQGSHLHFEVRVGDPHDYYATRNPDLWVQPWPDHGVLAGRVTDAEDMPLLEQSIELHAPDLNIRRELTTYADPDLLGDDVLAENFAIGDLPAGVYGVTIKHPGGTYKNTVTVYDGRVTWLSVTLP